MDDPNKRYRILIIDDDSFLLDMYALKFSQANFEVGTALGSIPALEKLKQEPDFDAILLDIIMPVMDGFELLEKMNKESLATGAIKIVLSNKGQQSDMMRCRKLGVTDYIVKASSTPTEVVNKVIDIIRENKIH